MIAAWVRLMGVDLVEKGLWEVLEGGRGWKGVDFGSRVDDKEKVLFWGQHVGREGGSTEEEAGVAVLYGM